MRFGHCPRVGDTFCGSGQIPFEAARLGCDVCASDLNPIASMLTWSAFNIIGGSADSRVELHRRQRQLVEEVQGEIDELRVESDGQGWRSKVHLYCLEARCPQTGWLVPMLPTRVVSRANNAVLDLVPDPANKPYSIQVRTGVSASEMASAAKGTLGRDSKYEEAQLCHRINGVDYRTKISTLRGDYQEPDGSTANRLRVWEKHDFRPRPDDVYQERLYAIQWMRPKKGGKTFDYEFRAVTEDDVDRERTVHEFIQRNLEDWQTVAPPAIRGSVRGSRLCTSAGATPANKEWALKVGKHAAICSAFCIVTWAGRNELASSWSSPTARTRPPALTHAVMA